MVKRRRVGVRDNERGNHGNIGCEGGRKTGEGGRGEELRMNDSSATVAHLPWSAHFNGHCCEHLSKQLSRA